jgi:hypothetical protein
MGKKQKLLDGVGSGYKDWPLFNQEIPRGMEQSETVSTV